MPVNSKRKGARGERELAAHLRAWGYGDARRGQQFSGTKDSPDVQGLPGFHIECKFTEKLELWPAMTQAMLESAHDEIALVVHRKKNRQWLAILSLDDLLTLVGSRRHSDSQLAAKLIAHAETWQRIGERHPAYRDRALVDDLRTAATLVGWANKQA